MVIKCGHAGKFCLKQNKVRGFVTNKKLLTMKKIIKNACAVIITLNNWWSPFRNCVPGADSSNLIKTEKAVPSKPEKTANIKYNVPISLALVEKHQREKLAILRKEGLNYF